MSTTVEQSRQENGRQYAEFDEYIDFQVQRLRSGIRTNDVFTALCGVAVIVTAYLLTFVLLDHWVIDGGFSHSSRLISMLLLVAGTVAWIGLRVVRPCLRRVNRLYAARVAESASVELDSNLLNYEDLRRAGRAVPTAILNALEKRAAVALSKSDVDDAIDRRLLLRLSVTLLTIVLIFCLYIVLTPKKVWPSIWRAVNPATATQVATQTEIIDVQPGNRNDVLARTLLDVTVDLRGQIPETVELVYSTLDRSIVDERVTLRRVDETLKRFACVLTGPDGDGLLQGLTYHIEAGDAVSPPFRIDVIQPPTVSVEQIHYAYPDYMELRPERRESPAIDAWEGTRLTLSASTNMPVARAWVEFSATESFPLNPEPLPMNVEDGTQISAEWRAMTRDDGQTPRFYRIRCRTESGASDPTPAVYPIEIHPDEKQEIEAVFPTGDLERPANAVVPLLLRASDPDFGLSRVTLLSRHGTIDLTDQVLWRGRARQTEVRHDLQLKELGLKPGDVLTWWGEARDNRVIESPTRRLKDNNVAITPQLRIQISEPVSEAEVSEQQAFDEQQRQDRLDELNQELRGESRPETEDSSTDRASEPTVDSEQNTGDGDNTGAPGQSDSSAQSETATSQTENAQSGNGKTGSGDQQSQNQSGSRTGEGSKSGPKSDEATPRERPEDGTSRPDGKPTRDGKSSSGEQPQDSQPADKTPSDQNGNKPRPVSKDGSDDDQVLRELLQKHQSQTPPDGDSDSSQSAGRLDDRNSTSPDTAPASSDASTGDPESSPNENTAGTPERPAPDLSPEKQGLPDRQPQGSAEQTPDRSDNNPQSRREDGTPGKPDSAAKPDPTSVPTPGAGENNDGAKSPSSDSGTSAKAGDGGDSPVPARNGNTQDNDNPDGEASTGSDQTSEPSKAGSSDNATKPESVTKQTSDPGARSGSGRPEAQNPSSDSASDSAKESGSGQAEPESGNNKGSGKPNGPSGSSSGSGERQAKGDSSSRRDRSSSDPKSATSSEGAGRAPEGSKPNESNPAGSDKPDDAGTPGNASGEGSPESKAGGNGGASEETRNEPSGTSAAADSKHSSDAESQKSQRVKSDDQKSGSESASSKSEGESQSGQAGESGSGGGASGSSQSASPSAGGKGMGSNGGEPGQAKSHQGSPASSDTPGGEPLPGGSGEDSGESGSAADPVNVEDRLKATNLVLKQLQDDLDRGNVDRELLDRLGWSEDDMRRFAERLEQRLSTDGENADPGEAARTRQFREMLKSLDLRASSRERLDSFGDKESTTDFSDLRERVPQRYRGAFEKYLDRLAGQKRGPTP